MNVAHYSGDILSQQAWRILSEDPRAILIDVRTVPEWQFVGVPDLTPISKNPVFIEWQVWPEMRPHSDFVAAVRASGAGEDDPLLLLCRSGVRSMHAAVALSAAGFKHCYNIQDGFEGQLDGDGHRGERDTGWKAEGLPWAQ